MPHNFQVSQATAEWLLQYCTRLVREAFGTDWMPIFGETPLGTTERRGFYDMITADRVMPLNVKRWIGGLISVAKVVASMIAFQYEPHEVPPMLNNLNEIDFEIEGYEVNNLPDDIDIDFSDID